MCGPITRASVSQASATVATMGTWCRGMMDKPFNVGTNGQHQFNRNGLPMRLETGRWRIAHVQGISE